MPSVGTLRDDKVVVVVSPVKGPLNSKTVRWIAYSQLSSVPVMAVMSWVAANPDKLEALAASVAAGSMLPWAVPVAAALVSVVTAGAAIHQRVMRPDIKGQPLYREPDLQAAKDAAKAGAVFKTAGGV